MVQFPDDATGFTAAKAQAKINIIKRKLTFVEFFGGKYPIYRGICPRSEMRQHEPGVYAARIAQTLPGSPSVNSVIAELVTA